MRGVLASRISPSMYHAFMDAGFRRSGRLIYQPICKTCRKCRPLRVNVAQFHPNKSQRRCQRSNADLKLSVAAPRADDEAFALYQRYAADWHEHVTSAPARDERAAFESFLYDSPVDTLEFRYRDQDGVLLAVGICDVSNEALSSVYFFFDPDAAARSLGTYGALREIDFAAQKGISYYYLGYWIEACSAMTYKARFRPFELLQDDGRWCCISSTVISAADKIAPVD
jgi:arginine-tRNA-protein transferase